MRSAVTLCQVAEAATGPFVFRGDLWDGFAAAARLGFDAVELFLGDSGDFAAGELRSHADEFGLQLAAFGTGAGRLRHGLSLADAVPARRREALAWLLEMVDFAGELGAPAILGSMQGSAGASGRERALDWLAEALQEAGAVAARHGQVFLYEPLNRYETDLHNRLGEAAAWLDAVAPANVLLLADFFHMNIEEADPAAAIRQAGSRIGHVHFADSNRRAMGCGHTDPGPLVAALRDSGYCGYLSAEILPLPDPESAARATLESIRSLFPAT
jgi:sugar phosphate isomerase/epimerase